MRDEIGECARDVLDVDVVASRGEVAEPKYVAGAKTVADVGQHVRVRLTRSVDVEQPCGDTDGVGALRPGPEQLLPRELSDAVDAGGSRDLLLGVRRVADRVHVRGGRNNGAGNAGVSGRSQHVLRAL